MPVRVVWLVLLGRLTDQPILPVTVVVDSTQDQYHRASRGVQHGQQTVQLSKKPSLLTIPGLSSIRWRRHRQARRNIMSKHCSVLKIEQCLCRLRRSVDAGAITRAVAHRCASSSSMRRRRAAFEPAITTFEHAQEWAGAQSMVHHAQPATRSAVEPVVADDAGSVKRHVALSRPIRTRRRNFAIELS